MKIIETILTKNLCYLAGEKISPKGLMLHSVGCNQPSAEVFVKKWNSQSSGDVCVHAFIDGNTGDVYQTLPWTHRAWHCGRSGNNTHISVEMCEPATIRYTSGSAWIDNNTEQTKAVVLRTYNSAVELFAYLCEKFSLNPLADGVIVSHSEGYKRGIASNHGDVEHIWSRFGLTMDRFRKDVKAEMDGNKKASTEKAENGTIYRVQVGAYKNIDNATKQLKSVKNKGFDAIVVKVDELYKVQVGAFGVKANAETMRTKVKNAGFDAIVTTKGGTTIKVEEKKTVLEIAKEVVQGKWGNGTERQKKITSAGYNYAEVQKMVNQLMK